MERGPIELSEMLRTFNCGIGMLLIVNPNKLADIQNELAILKQPSVEIGTIEKINKIEYSGLLKIYKFFFSNRAQKASEHFNFT